MNDQSWQTGLDVNDQGRVYAMASLLNMVRSGGDTLFRAKDMCQSYLSDDDKAMLVFAVIRSMTPNVAMDAVAAAVEIDSPPSDFRDFMTYAFDGKQINALTSHWAENVPPIATKSMLIGCFNALSPEIRVDFLKWAQKQ